MSKDFLNSRELEMRRVFENIDDIRRHAESIIVSQGRIRDSLHVIFADGNVDRVKD
jgi:hypothetical protein